MWGFIAKKFFFGNKESKAESAAEKVSKKPVAFWIVGLWFLLSFVFVGFFIEDKTATQRLALFIFVFGSVAFLIFECDCPWERCPACGEEHPVSKENVFRCYTAGTVYFIQSCQVCGRKRVVPMEENRSKSDCKECLMGEKIKMEKINNDFVSVNGKDICVLCREETPYDVKTPVCEREHYREGCGQLCQECDERS